MPFLDSAAARAYVDSVHPRPGILGLLIGVLLLNASLCPCAALANGETPATSAEVQDRDRQSSSHGHHGKVKAAEPAPAADDHCDGEPRGGCDMADESQANARPANGGERTSIDDGPALLPQTFAVLRDRLAGVVPWRQSAILRPPDSPVHRNTRLQI